MSTSTTKAHLAGIAAVRRSKRNRKLAPALIALALACAAAPSAAFAQELGRLFFTPQQREDLDRRRASNRAEEEAPQIREGPLTLDGHVQRSSGRTTTWINRTPEYDDGRVSADPARVTVAPNPGEPGVSLKVGQTYDRASGEVRGLLGGGEVEVGAPPKPGPVPERRAPAAKAAPR